MEGWCKDPTSAARYCKSGETSHTCMPQPKRYRSIIHVSTLSGLSSVLVRVRVRVWVRAGHTMVCLETRKNPRRIPSKRRILVPAPPILPVPGTGSISAAAHPTAASLGDVRVSWWNTKKYMENEESSFCFVLRFFCLFMVVKHGLLSDKNSGEKLDIYTEQSMMYS